jgi:hypothetical protein
VTVLYGPTHCGHHMHGCLRLRTAKAATPQLSVISTMDLRDHVGPRLHFCPGQTCCICTWALSGKKMQLVNGSALGHACRSPLARKPSLRHFVSSHTPGKIIFKPVIVWGIVIESFAPIMTAEMAPKSTDLPR